MLNARPVEGMFRFLRSYANAGLIAVLFAIPWLRLNGEPLVLLDVPARRFHILGLVIFPQELYFLWLLIIGAALALFFFTALFGRLWCGWACPQTVFTDVFAGIARRIEGWKGSRRPKHVAAWRLALKHLVWVVASAVIGFHLIGYFVSPYQFIADARAGTLHPVAIGFWGVTSTISYLDFVFLRQTFCKYLCPYARFQGVLFDKDTLVIGYDEARGEPRGKKGSTAGDCVDCGLCVAVCPSGIDIRDGLQLGCIACTQCIDACDAVMERTGRQKQLIAYRTLAGVAGWAGVRPLRARVVVYGLLLLCVFGSFGMLLGERQAMGLEVSHNRESLYTTMPDGRIGNSFTLQVENRESEDRRFHIRLEEDEDFELVAGMNPLTVPGASAVEARVFVIARDTHGSAAPRRVRFVLEPEDRRSRGLVRETRFLSPGVPHGDS
jgi:cytochrome c oxidase accessory protein FixG